MVGSALALIAAGVAVALAVRDRTTPSTPPEATHATAPPNEVVTAAPAAKPAQMQPAPKQAEVELEVVSTPSGAKVFENGKDGRQLGTTPFKATFKHSDASLKLWIERTGYRPREESVSLRENHTVSVVLERSKPKAGPRVDPNESRKI